jgi:HD-GYP domain-containing protein (c-di-GMP phosphodiesterase class II)
VPDVRLAEAVGALSLAVDIGMGQPLEQGLRTCSIASGLARAAGLDEDDCRRVYYLALLRHVGCTAESDVAAHFLGDEIAFRRGAITLDFSKPSSVLPYAFTHVGAGRSWLGRLAQFATMAAGSKTFMGSVNAVCETGQLMAARLGLEPEIQTGLWHVFERWDGKGLPGLVAGEDIAVPARFVFVSELFEAVCRLEDAQRAVEAVTERRGSAYDPAVVDCLRDVADDLVARLDQESIWDSVLDDEPGERPTLSDARFDEVLAAMADFTDLKSVYTLGHSRGVAELAADAGRVAGLGEGAVTSLRRAGWVHDLGRVGISASVWGKEGSLSRDEWEKVRLHPYYTERALTRPPALAELGRLASMHHEKVDGGGYHRGVGTAVLSRRRGSSPPPTGTGPGSRPVPTGPRSRRATPPPLSAPR